MSSGSAITSISASTIWFFTRRVPIRSGSSGSMPSRSCLAASPRRRAGRNAQERMTSLEVIALTGLPLIEAGDDLAGVIASILKQNSVEPRAQDVLVVAQKIVSKAEGRMVDLATIKPSAQARTLAADVDKDARLVEVILSEFVRVVRARRNVLIVEHRLGFSWRTLGWTNRMWDRGRRPARASVAGESGPQRGGAATWSDSPDRN